MDLKRLVFLALIFVTGFGIMVLNHTCNLVYCIFNNISMDISLTFQHFQLCSTEYSLSPLHVIMCDLEQFPKSSHILLL